MVRYTVGQLDQLVELNPNERYVLRELATNYRVLAAILEEQERVHEAYAAFRKSAGYCEKLVPYSPATHCTIGTSAVSNFNSGRLMERGGDHHGRWTNTGRSDSARRAAGLDGRWGDLVKRPEERVLPPSAGR